LQLTVYNAQ
jgi:hypothetical protein